ncbi:MAG: HEAT repeat domain-containing protein [Pirellulales bacterium]|nr:HEAT repeat domain-containing protein [Pirellulales bacterium]
MSSHVCSSLVALSRSFRTGRPGHGWPVVGLAFLAVSLCCGCQDSSPAGAELSLASDYNEATNVLENVQDTDSAASAVSGLERSFVRIQKSRDRKSETMPKTIDEETKEHFEAEQKSWDAGTKLAKEIQRVLKIPDLPQDFYRVVRRMEAQFFSSAPGKRGPDARVVRDSVDFKKTLRTTLEEYEPREVIVIRLTNLPADYAQKAFDRLGAGAPGASLVHRSYGQNGQQVCLAPVKDYSTLKRAINFGEVTWENPSAGLMNVTVERTKLGAPADSEAEEARKAYEARQEERRKRREARLAQPTRHGLPPRDVHPPTRENDPVEPEPSATPPSPRPPHPEPRHAAPERPARPRELDANGPDYYEELADRLLSDNMAQQRQAISTLLAVQPDKIESPETHKKIARAFRTLAQDSRSSTRRDGIRGLVVWGGEFSTPILLEMFKSSSSVDRKPIYEAFGQLKDPAAVPTVAAQLADRRERLDAAKCLAQIGPAAEDAVLQMAPSSDPLVCVTAIELLGRLGTQKSLPTLRKAMASRNVRVKQAAKTAVDQIRARTAKGGSS